jgi:hypothetical protein
MKTTPVLSFLRSFPETTDEAERFMVNFQHEVKDLDAQNKAEVKQLLQVNIQLLKYLEENV